jgi:hypothetical protein
MHPLLSFTLILYCPAGSPGNAEPDCQSGYWWIGAPLFIEYWYVPVPPLADKVITPSVPLKQLTLLWLLKDAEGLAFTATVTGFDVTAGVQVPLTTTS